MQHGEFVVAKDRALLEALFRLRHDVYVGELALYDPEPDQRMWDDFDFTSENHLAIVEGQVVGGTRLAVPGEGSSIDRLFDFPSHLPGPPAIALGASAVLVAKDYRHGELTLGLLGFTCRRAKALGATHIYGAIRPELLGFFQKQGYRVIGERQTEADTGMQTLPILLDLAKVTSRVADFANTFEATRLNDRVAFSLSGKRLVLDSAAVTP